VEVGFGLAAGLQEPSEGKYKTRKEVDLREFQIGPPSWSTTAVGKNLSNVPSRPRIPWCSFVNHDYGISHGKISLWTKPFLSFL